MSAPTRRAVLAAAILVTFASAGVAGGSTPSTGGLVVSGRLTTPGTFGLFRVDLPGRHPVRLTSPPDAVHGGIDLYPVWSRDGREIAFVRKPAARVFIVGSDGRGLHVVGDVHATSQLAWGPGDSEIAFGVDGNGIWTVHPDGTGLKRLCSRCDQPAWSPDGRTILFTRDGDIFAMSATGGDVRLLLRRPSGSTAKRDFYDLEAPAWSPDGKTVAFVQEHGYEGFGPPTLSVWTANADGSHSSQLVPISDTDGAVAVSWTRDGRFVTFQSTRGKVQGIFAVPSGGGAPTLVYGGNWTTIELAQPTWDPASP